MGMNMSDLISRQVAIERATKEHDFYRGASLLADKARRDELLNVMCWLNELPSAEPQWIPVSEKLPKYSDSVLISACGYEIDIGSYYCDKWHINGCGPVEDGIVIAWMPLPKPYKGDKE